MKKNILIVEDEALIALSLKERVEDLGYNVSAIVDRGEDVMSKIEKSHPDLILMDIFLKGDQDGIETATLIKEKHDDIPVVFLTSYANKSVVDRAKKIGPYGYIIKTTGDENLHITIDVALEKKKLENHQKKKQINEISKFRSLYDNNTNFIIRFDLSGKIIYTNPVCSRFLGKQPQEIIGEQIESTVLNDSVSAIFNEIIAKIILKKRKSFSEYTMPTMMGDRFVEVNAIPETNDENQIETILLVIRDVTDQKIAVTDMQKKHKSISDSINYSKRIQNAIFPQLELLNNYFDQAFIINKPKDGIGGDFPWVVKNDKNVYMATIDCTGHGVPGALMSLVTYFLIDKITSRQKNLSPGKILDILHLSVNRALKQHYNLSDSRDGADVAMSKINLDEMVLEYAGAHRPLFLYRNNELTEVKGDRYPIGGVQYKHRKRFHTNIIELLKDDVIITFSDGLPDQFGSGENANMKFGLKRIRQLITTESNWKMDQLSDKLEKAFSTWKGHGKQIDDILVMGVKI